MPLWNDRRTPPGVTTDISVQLGAQYAAPKPQAAKPGTHTTASSVGKAKPKPVEQRRQFGKKK